MANPIFSKEDLCLLMSALSFYIEHSSLEASCDFQKECLYANHIDFDNHLKILSRSRVLQKRLIVLLNNFD